MASGIYTYFKAHILDAEYDLSNGGDSIKVILLDNSHGFTATHDSYSDISANELAAAGGYTQNDEVLANQAVSIDDGDGEGVFDADDVAWTSATFTAYHCVLYDDTHATDKLICSIDFGGAQTVTAGTFTIQWDTEGIINIT